MELFYYVLYRYARWLEEGALELLDVSKAKDNQEACRCLRACEPALMRNTGLLMDKDSELASISKLVSA